MKKEQELRKVKRKMNPIFAKGLSVIGKIREMGASLSSKYSIVFDYTSPFVFRLL